MANTILNRLFLNLELHLEPNKPGQIVQLHVLPAELQSRVLFACNNMPSIAHMVVLVFS